MTNLELKRRLRLSGLIILLVGLSAALFLYHFGVDVPDDTLGYMVVNGTAYPLSTSDSKRYRHDLERFGGKTAVMFDDFNRWFTQLWQGKALGTTIAWISALVALGLFLFAQSLPDAVPDSQDPGGRDGHH
jgi:hypothetical protein